MVVLPSHLYQHDETPTLFPHCHGQNGNYFAKASDIFPSATGRILVKLQGFEGAADKMAREEGPKYAIQRGDDAAKPCAIYHDVIVQFKKHLAETQQSETDMNSLQSSNSSDQTKNLDSSSKTLKQTRILATKSRKKI